MTADTLAENGRTCGPPACLTELAPLSAYDGGDAVMKASSTIKQFAAAPAATIATAVQAERPRAGEPTIRLGRLLSEQAREAESMYAFLYFTRGGSGTVYYAPPGALVHADAQLCRARNAQDSVLALAKVCGGSGQEAAPPAPSDEYPETIPMVDGDDGFDAAGLYLDRIVGTDDLEDATPDERAAAAKAYAEAIGGMVYTQVDTSEGDGIAYERGLHLVNRTGVYAVVQSVRHMGDKALVVRQGVGVDVVPSDQLVSDDAWNLEYIIGEADLMVDRAKPDDAAKLVAKATRLLAESMHDAREGGAIGSDVQEMINDARNCMAQASAVYRSLAEHADAAVAAAYKAWRGAAAAQAGKCPVRAYIEAPADGAEYVDEWYDLSSEQRDELCELGEESEMYTDEYRARLEKFQADKREHDKTCRHRACIALRAAPAPTGVEAAAACSGKNGGGKVGL